MLQNMSYRIREIIYFYTLCIHNSPVKVAKYFLMLKCSNKEQM